MPLKYKHTQWQGGSRESSNDSQRIWTEVQYQESFLATISLHSGILATTYYFRRNNRLERRVHVAGWRPKWLFLCIQVVLLNHILIVYSNYCIPNWRINIQLIVQKVLLGVVVCTCRLLTFLRVQRLSVVPTKSMSSRWHYSEKILLRTFHLWHITKQIPGGI